MSRGVTIQYGGCVYQITAEGPSFHCNLLYIFWISYPVNGESGDHVEWSLQTEERNEAKDKSRIFQRRLESSGG